MLLLFAAASASAQFSGLSTTQDGTRIYFASALPQRGTNQQFGSSNIFLIDPQGCHFVHAGAQVQVSGDGQTLVYSDTFTTVTETDLPPVNYLANWGAISRNGRFVALNYWNPPNNPVGPGFPVTSPIFSLIDRISGQTIFQGTQFAWTISIAGDGTTAVVTPGGLQLIKGGNVTTLYGSGVSSAAIDDGATEIVYGTLSPQRLFATDLTSGRQWQVGPNDQDSYQPSLSSDGGEVLYLSKIGATAQLFFSPVNGSATTQLTNLPSGVVEATLSGDGKTALAVTGDGSLLSIETATGDASTLIGPTPEIGDSFLLVPGSIATINATGFKDESLLLSGVPVPILSASDNQITIQVPWEIPLSATAVTSIVGTIPEGGAPYFIDMALFNAISVWPQAIPVDTDSDIAVHGDFRSIVTAANPAVPGEAVHIYLSGGGPTSCSVATGSPAPLGTLCPIQTPIWVYNYSNYQGLDTSFFGLAPGMTGIYQLDVMVPPDWTSNRLFVALAFYDPRTGIAEGTILQFVSVKAGN